MRDPPSLRTAGIGQLLFAVGFAVIGAIGLGARDFVLTQEPVPKDLPWREGLACLNALLLLLPGLGLLVTRTAKAAALVLTAFLALWVLVLQLPHALAHPSIEGSWLGVGEDTTLVTGGWVIYCAIAGRDDASLSTARRLFGLALVPIGLSHFFYLQGAAQLIPAWFPLRVPLTAFCGAAHIAAGLALFFGIVPRLAATLEAIMESIFTLVCWLTAVIATPTDRQDWANLFISTALSAAAWAVARSYRERSFGWVRSASQARS